MSVLNVLSGLESRWDVARGYRVHARVSEAAAVHGRAPVVLVHGLSVSSRYFVPTAAHLAPYYPVYAPDLPGYGLGDKPRRVLDLHELADTLAEWMHVSGLGPDGDGPVALVGNSMGCQIIAQLASRYPQLVRCAVLVGPTMDRHGRTMFSQGMRLLMDLLVEPSWSWVIQGRDYAGFGPRRLLTTLRYALNDPIEAHLPHFRVPVLVVRGGRDPIVPQRWAEEVTRLLPDARLTVVPRAGHAVNTNSPRQLARLTRAFLAEVLPAELAAPSPLDPPPEQSSIRLAARSEVSTALARALRRTDASLRAARRNLYLAE